MKRETLEVTGILTMPIDTTGERAAEVGRMFALDCGPGCVVVTIGSLPAWVILVGSET